MENMLKDVKVTASAWGAAFTTLLIMLFQEFEVTAFETGEIATIVAAGGVFFGGLVQKFFNNKEEPVDEDVPDKVDDAA